MEIVGNHIVCIPYPALSHIKPMLKIAQLLHFIFGFHVTFLNTHYIHKTYFQNHPPPPPPPSSSFNDAPIFKFESFPESFDYDSNDLLPLLNAILNDELKLPLKEILMSKLSSISSDNNSRLCCMISDVAMSSFTLEVAQELGIRAVLLETASACSLLAYFHTRQLLDKGIIPLRDKGDLTNGYLEKEIDWIPSLKGICLKDMPTSIRTTNPNDMFLNITMLNSSRGLNSETTLILNTFDALDQDVLRDLSTISPTIYPIGPLHSMVEYHISKNNNGDTISVGPTISSEDGEHMMNWLDSQEPKSVLYVCFGTLFGVTQETLMELAWGLANSHSNFLWIMRPGLVIGGRDSPEFDRFEKEVEGRGVLASWCDQERVLGHPSIGGFLTHCGWNSTIESISNGVPMICWPFNADQTTNSWRCCHGLGIGVKMTQEVQRDAIEKVVKELMQEQKGKEIRASAMKWKELTKEAIMKPHGSSYVNLDNLVQNILKM